ncbi:MAG TPA: HD domain-containing phosphohydrolase [Dermatophilaceae bacterium]|nr:HD domain-containing phosphohydrolase [Dermatophilaceae bacterium]
MSGLLLLAMGAWSMAVVVARLRQSPTFEYRSLVLIVGVFLIVIVIGEVFRVREPGSRHTAPLATAAALAFAMTVEAPTGNPANYGAPLVIAVTAVAMAVGLVPSVIHRRVIRVPDLANSLVGIAVAATLFREVPISEGRTVLDLQASWPPELLALVMVVVSAFALTIEVLLLAVMRATRSHAPCVRTFQDEFIAAAGLTAALSATGALVALAERPLGVVAIPLFLFPLGLTQFAVRRQSAIRRTYRQTIRTLSRLTELGGYTEPGHAERVAELSLAMGHQLGMSERDVLDLEYSALLHDIGQVSLAEPIPGGATVLAAPADQRRIAHDGAEIVRQTGVLDKVAVILEAQTTSYRQVRELGEDLPLASRIIKVCNAYDDMAGVRPNLARRVAAMERINLGLGYEYDPRVVDALVRVLDRDPH